MGFFDIFKKKEPVNSVYAQMINGFTPIFSQFGTDIYASDVVQQALSCITQEMKKLQPQHIRKGKNDRDTLSVYDSSIQNVLENPNALMSTADFLEKIVWQLFFNYNSFIVPTYDKIINKDGTETRRYNGLYPIQPTQVDFLESAGEMYIKLRFSNNYETTLPYNDVIHIRHKFSVNEYLGGNEFGQPDNEILLKTLELNNTMLEGISKAMQASYAINGIVKYNTMLDKDKMDGNIKQLVEHLKNNESGFLPLDLKGEFIPFKKEIKFVDGDTLKFIDEKILRTWGISIPILTGDYSKEQYEAFYQKTLEPLIISISQAFTKTLFTPREKSFGNKIALFSKELIFMSTTQKLEMIRLLGDTGSLFENEKRVAMGLLPLPELEGVRMQSLNYVDTEYAKEYQTKVKQGIPANSLDNEKEVKSNEK